MDELICASCDKPKQHLQPVKSRLLPGMQFNSCQDCITKKFEPRFIVILAANQFGTNDLVKDYIKKHRYVGNIIPASDII